MTAADDQDDQPPLESFARLLRQMRQERDPLLGQVLLAAHDDRGWRSRPLAATCGMTPDAVSKRIERARLQYAALERSEQRRTSAAVRRAGKIPKPPEVGGMTISDTDTRRLRAMRRIASRVNGSMAADHPSRGVTEQLSREINELVTREHNPIPISHVAKMLGISPRAVTSRLERHHFRPPPPSIADQPKAYYRKRKINDPPTTGRNHDE